MPTQNGEQDFIANCFYHIRSAACAPANERQRDVDFAEAVRIAARNGEEAAHKYLVALADEARHGKYEVRSATKRKRRALKSGSAER